MNKGWWILKIVKGIVFFSLFLFVASWVIMHLWNFFVPSVMHFGVINYTQALALLVLSRLLFGGFGRHGHHGWKKHGHHGHWKDRFEAKMANMSPEEREKFKAQWRGCANRWGKSWPEEPAAEAPKSEQ